MTPAGNSDPAPLDPQHGSSGGGGPVFPDPTIPQPEIRHRAADLEPESPQEPCGLVDHPSWCNVPTCHVRIRTGTPFGAHRSKVVTLPGRVEVRLSLWALHGDPP